VARETIIEKTETSITFRVDDVDLARDPLPTQRPRDAIRARTGVTIEAASDIVRPFVPAQGHGLVSTVQAAFLTHRPLVLGPDAIWQAIAQGFADHVNANPEQLRARLVPHQGKKKLVVPMSYLERSPENPWAAAFERMSKLVREHSHPEAHQALDVDFSTSGPVERAARAFVLLDAFQAYFEYEMMCLCGVPWVRLEGTPADWRLVAEKLEALGRFGLEWWVASVRPVVRELLRTSLGEPDPAFWRSIFQWREVKGGYGGPTTYVSGWIVRFAPWVGEAPQQRKNPVVTGESRDVSPGLLPRGFAQVPFVLAREDKPGERRATNMVAFAGIMGMDQDERTLALRPKILWAVGREPEKTPSA
jgi:hypothetical protein